MKFIHKNMTAGAIDVSGKHRPIDETGVFEVPDDTNLEVLERLEQAGHKKIVSTPAKVVPQAAVVKKPVEKPDAEEKEPEENPPIVEKEAAKAPEAKEESKPEAPTSPPPSTPTQSPRELLESVSGVGPALASKILDKYMSMEEIVEDGAENLAKNVSGIGPELAETIIATIRG